MKQSLMVVSLLLMVLSAIAQEGRMKISPLDYGWNEAQSDTARYNVLYKTHCEAVTKGCDVDYCGLGDFSIEVPHKAASIPLTKYNDFENSTITVLNRDTDKPLFVLKKPTYNIHPTAQMVDSGDFSLIPELAEGTHLLIVEDNNPWVGERIGYSYPFYRKDVLLVVDGKSINRPVSPYSTPSTKMKCSMVNIDTVQKVVKNITINRHPNSTAKSYAVAIYNDDNVLISNVTINTPKSKLTADGTIVVSCCTRICMEDVVINGTYSASKKYGYAFSMNNVWNASFLRVKATGNWGVFGTNNLSNTTLDSCDINRFDIHCYGRDAVMRNCTFRKKQTQFSSMYGSVVFENCHFVNNIPIRIRSSYNAYTPFDIYFRDCTFEATLRNHSLVNVMLLDTNRNARPELSERCWPNVYIDNMVINTTTKNVNIYNPTGTTSMLKDAVFDYICAIGIKKLTLLHNGKKSKVTLSLSDKNVQTSNSIRLEFLEAPEVQLEYGFINMETHNR